VTLSPLSSLFLLSLLFSPHSYLSSCFFDPRFGIPSTARCLARDCAASYSRWAVAYWQQLGSFSRNRQAYAQSRNSSLPYDGSSTVQSCNNDVNGCAMYQPYLAFLRQCRDTLTTADWSAWTLPLPSPPQKMPSYCDQAGVAATAQLAPVPLEPHSCIATSLSPDLQMAWTLLYAPAGQNLTNEDLYFAKVKDTCHFDPRRDVPPPIPFGGLEINCARAYTNYMMCLMVPDPHAPNLDPWVQHCSGSQNFKPSWPADWETNAWFKSVGSEQRRE
jgi:hypothetical protein